MVIRRFDVYLINLDPTIGSEIKKIRPCVVVSPDEMNRYVRTVIVAPMTTKGQDVVPLSVEIRGAAVPRVIMRFSSPVRQVHQGL